MGAPTLDSAADAEEVCPQCGGETGVQKWTAAECVHGDTSVRYCIECDWKADPE